MQIQLKDVGRKYRREWIFRGINTLFESGKRYAIVGPNGSGKSTLMRTLSGHLSPSKGRLFFGENETEKADFESIYTQVAYAAPYIDLIEEMTLREHIKFHAGFKPFFKAISDQSVLDILNLKGAADKEIRFFSSGMKQRVKLALSILSDTSIMLLDEPSTNLDTQGIDWYLDLVAQYSAERICIIASNDAVDIAACGEQLNILDFKGKNSAKSK